MGRWKIKQELEPIGLTALALSLLAVGAQFLAWMRGPDIKTIPPDKIAIYADKSPEGLPIVRVGAPISYANLAQPPFGALVTSERLKFTIGKLQSEQQWNAFGLVEKVDGNLKVTSNSQALPQALPAQSFVSHFTLFTPIRRNCSGAKCDPEADYISPGELQAAGATQGRMRFDFSIVMIDGKTITTSCEVILHDIARRLLANLPKSAFYARCYLPADG